jgi:hypothetical protein
VLVLPGVGHVAMMERPGTVAAEVRAFLDGVKAASGPELAAGRLSDETAANQVQS